LPFWSEEVPNNIFRYHVEREGFKDGYPKFSEDFSRKAYEGWTVTYVCLQLAVYMGFKEIYLIGVDFNYSANLLDERNHFSPDYIKPGGTVGNIFVEEVRNAYTSAKKYADSHGLKIYNATRGGKLEVFERVDFDDLFN